MKNQLIAIGLFTGALCLAGCAIRSTEAEFAPPPPPSPPVVYQSLPPRPAASTPAAPAPVYVYDQKLMPNTPVLVSPEQAQAIVDQFHSNYTRLGSPRILIYVNRQLVDHRSGLALSARTEQVTTTRTSNGGMSSNATDQNGNVISTSTANNTYRDNASSPPTLADRQTVRDVERLMGRPLRAAGAALVDQSTAAQLVGDRPLESITLENDQARKDREAVGRIADVAIEVLISSRNVTVPTVAGDRTYAAPDIQVTAIRLNDARVIGQASAVDVMNRVGGPGMAARNYTVEDITEATALSLMQDLVQEAR